MGKRAKANGYSPSRAHESTHTRGQRLDFSTMLDGLALWSWNSLLGKGAHARAFNFMAHTRLLYKSDTKGSRCSPAKQCARIVPLSLKKKKEASSPRRLHGGTSQVPLGNTVAAAPCCTAWLHVPSPRLAVPASPVTASADSAPACSATPPTTKVFNFAPKRCVQRGACCVQSR